LSPSICFVVVGCPEGLGDDSTSAVEPWSLRSFSSFAHSLAWKAFLAAMAAGMCGQAYVRLASAAWAAVCRRQYRTVILQTHHGALCVCMQPRVIHWRSPQIQLQTATLWGGCGPHTTPTRHATPHRTSPHHTTPHDTTRHNTFEHYHEGRPDSAIETRVGLWHPDGNIVNGWFRRVCRRNIHSGPQDWGVARPLRRRRDGFGRHWNRCACQALDARRCVLGITC
jgi:hypothetical protein